MGADASRGWLLSLACWCWGRARNNTPVYDWLAGHGQWHVAGGFVHWRPRALCGSIGELSFSFSFALVFFFGQRIFVHKMSCRIARAESLLGCERIYSSCSVQTCPLYFYDLPVLTYQHDPTCSMWHRFFQKLSAILARLQQPVNESCTARRKSSFCRAVRSLDHCDTGQGR